VRREIDELNDHHRGQLRDASRDLEKAKSQLVDLATRLSRTQAASKHGAMPHRLAPPTAHAVNTPSHVRVVATRAGGYFLSGAPVPQNGVPWDRYHGVLALGSAAKQSGWKSAAWPAHELREVIEVPPPPQTSKGQNHWSTRGAGATSGSSPTSSALNPNRLLRSERVTNERGGERSERSERSDGGGSYRAKARKSPIKTKSRRTANGEARIAHSAVGRPLATVPEFAGAWTPLATTATLAVMRRWRRWLQLRFANYGAAMPWPLP
jgi:hypothetical protein